MMDGFNMACDKFYSSIKANLNKYFPLRKITVTSGDPVFVTAGINALLRKHNKCMHKGHTIAANELMNTIRQMIIRNNADSFSLVNMHSATRKSWKKINQLLKPEKKQSDDVIHTSIEAGKLNDHYATISTNVKYTRPDNKQTVTMYSTSKHKFFKEYDI